jgi:hypothetical protein
MQHPEFPKDPTLGGAVVFAEFYGLTCSICAPRIMDEAEVEVAAMVLLQPRGRPWKAVDKSKPPISIGAPTPSPCNQYPDRQHWFLISDPF